MTRCPLADLAYRDPRTGELTTKGGEPVGPDDPTTYLLIIENVVVMERERAEKYGLEILGPAEDAPEGVVRIPPDEYTKIPEVDCQWRTQ